MNPKVNESDNFLNILKFLSPYNNEKLTNIENIDWDIEFKKLIAHRLAPLLYWKLKENNQNNEIPAEVEKKLSKVFLNTLQTNICVMHDLKNIIMDIEELDYALVKGPHLAEIIYPNAGTRPFADIDILIEKKDSDFTENILSKNDFIELNIEKKYKTVNEIVYKKMTDNLRYMVDIHSCTLHNARFNGLRINNATSFLSETELIKVNGLNIKVLTPEALIIYLNIHCVYAHFYDQIIYLLDILYSFKYYGDRIDFDKLNHMAKKLGILKSLQFTIELIDKIFETSLSNNFKSRKSSYFLGILMDSDKIYSIDDNRNYRKRFIMQPLLLDSHLESMKVMSGVIATIFNRNNQ